MGGWRTPSFQPGRRADGRRGCPPPSALRGLDSLHLDASAVQDGCKDLLDPRAGVEYNRNMRSHSAPPAHEDLPASLASLRRGIDGLRRGARSGLASADLWELIRSVSSLRSQLDSVLTDLVGAVDRQRPVGEDEPQDPVLSCAALLADELHMTRSSAYAQIRLARQLRDLPATAAAFAGGELSYGHAVAISRTVEGVVRGGGQAEVAESMLLREAKERNPHDLLMWGRHLRHRLNPAELSDDEDEQHRRQWLNLSRIPNGGFDIEGHLDAEGGTTLKVALDAVLGPRRKDDDRSPSLRRAVGLTELARRCLDSGELPVRGGVRPHIMVTTTLETLRGDPGSPAAELDWGWPLSGDSLRRIACDADLTPILLGKDGNPLYVGRARRTASPRMRKALAQRDRHCTWPGCDRPPAWCQGNHDPLWIDGGRTDIPFLGLLCTPHHRMFHRGYRLRRLADGRVEVSTRP